jgi:outer membrane immunogenic protein
MSKFNHLRWPLACVIAAGLAPAVQAQTERDLHFDGPYIAVFGGYAFQPQDSADRIEFDVNRDGTFGDTVVTAPPASADAFSPGFCGGYATSTGPGTGCDNDRDGAEFGARMGFDKRMGSGLVVGALVEVSKTDVRDATSAFSTTPARYTIERDMDLAVSARARLGFTPGGGALFYATGGGSYARVNHNFLTSNGLNSFTPNDDSDWVWGWQAGGGAEIMVTPKVSLGLEYLYSRYDDNDYEVAVGPGTALLSNPFLLSGGGTNLRAAEDRFDFHTVRATLGFRF